MHSRVEQAGCAGMAVWAGMCGQGTLLTSILALLKP